MARTVTSVVAAVAGVATAVALAVTPPVAHAAVDPFSDRSGPPGADRGPERSQAAGHAYRHGLVPTREADAKIRAFRAAHPLAGPQDLSYGGGEDGIGVTTGSPKVYLVFWGSQWGTPTTDTQGNVHLSGDGNGMAPRLQQLFEGIGTANELWSGVTTQYCEGITKGAQSCPDNSAHVGYPTGGALAGVWVDSGAAEPAAADPRQIGLEAIAAASHFGNTNAAANRNAQYVVVSSHGLMPDNFPKAGFCAWHDWNGDGSFPGGPIQSTVGDIAFTNLPYVTDAAGSCGENFVHPGADGVLDGVTIVEGHEYAETITDQNPSGGWNDAGGEENADKCAWLNSGPGAIVAVPFTTGSFAMQSTWSNDGSGCQMSHPIVGGGGGNDFTVSVSPSASPLTGGQSATLTATIATTAAPGFGATVALSATNLPAGITASLRPASVPAGGSATLTLHADGSTPVGNYVLAVSGNAVGANPAITRVASYSIAVVAPSGAVNNGTFESGLSGWQTTGLAFVLANPVHSGFQAVQLGSFDPTNDSTLKQTFTVRSGQKKLSFWYHTECPDIVQLDWFTVTLRDNTTKRTTTLVAHTCDATFGFAAATATVRAGHNYTLTFTNHDDHATGDGTLTVIDDVATS